MDHNIGGTCSILYYQASRIKFWVPVLNVLRAQYKTFKKIQAIKAIWVSYTRFIDNKWLK